MKITVTQDDLRIANIVPNDNTRPDLEQVYLHNNELFAADGFMIVRRPISVEGDTSKRIHFPAKLARLAKLLKWSRLELEILDDSASISQDEHKVSIPNTAKGGDWDINSFYGKAGEAKAVVTLSIKILTKLLKSLPQDGHISFRIAEPLQPVEFIAKSEGDIQAKGLIMPFHASFDSTKWDSDR